MANNVQYIIITPARDEEKHIELTLKSVIAQSVLPSEWIVVNDGSKDNTGSIIDDYAKRYPWIHAVHRSDRGCRKAGGGVVEAFYDGYVKVVGKAWCYIVKLDGDLSFDETYFQNCFEEFQRNPRLGIAGGMVYHSVNGGLQLEENPLFHVRGATKIYKRECWDAIGELIRAPGWDTLDEVKASMLGWETRSFPDLKVIHHRFTGAADGAWRNWVKNGTANYISGYHPLFMFLKCIKRAFQRPYLVGALALAWGFVGGYLKGIPQIGDRRLINYLRKQQIRKLMLMDSIWK
jgi:poly-beta-1,6-N-acetyl-D-glucosamine synthase